MLTLLRVDVIVEVKIEARVEIIVDVRSMTAARIGKGTLLCVNLQK